MKRQLYKIGATALAKTAIPISGGDTAVLTTWEAIIPKSLLAQFNTHRVFSRNTSSNRAIPTRRIIRDFLHVTPVSWRLNSAGMQPKDVPGTFRTRYFQFVWWLGKQMAKLTARLLLLGDNFPWLVKLLGDKSYYVRGAHKEITNRVIEPYMYAAVIASTTSRKNFFRLRVHPKAQAEFHVAARAMMVSDEEARTIQSRVHLPLIVPVDLYDRVNREELDPELWVDLISRFCRINTETAVKWYKTVLLNDIHKYAVIVSKEFLTAKNKKPEPAPMEEYQAIDPMSWFFLFAMSSAKTARGSYLNHLEPNSIQSDLKVFKQQMLDEPEHASSSEHQAMSYKMYLHLRKKFKFSTANEDALNGNFKPGIVQFRKLIERWFDHE